MILNHDAVPTMTDDHELEMKVLCTGNTFHGIHIPQKEEPKLFLITVNFTRNMKMPSGYGC